MILGSSGRQERLFRSFRSNRVLCRVHRRGESSGRCSRTVYPRPPGIPSTESFPWVNRLNIDDDRSSTASSSTMAAPGTTITSLVSASSTTAEKEDLVSTEIGSSSSFHQRLAAAAAAAAHRASPPPLFPWRHSPELLPRLDPTRVEYEEQGQLLGGGVTKSTTMNGGGSRQWWDEEMATAWLFLNVPLVQLAFFSDWKQEMATDMSWAFTQGVAGILSNVYQGRFHSHVFHQTNNKHTNGNNPNTIFISFGFSHFAMTTCKSPDGQDIDWGRTLDV